MWHSIVRSRLATVAMDASVLKALRYGGPVGGCAVLRQLAGRILDIRDRIQVATGSAPSCPDSGKDLRFGAIGSGSAIPVRWTHGDNSLEAGE